jgi:hypothetical protein
LTRPSTGGLHAASVSIRSGRGSATHDRVLRLLPVFATSAEASRYAAAEGLAWLDQNMPCARADALSPSTSLE